MSVSITGERVGRMPAERAIADNEAAMRRMPFALRCGAWLIDYTAVAGVIAFSTVLAQVLGAGARWTGDATLTLGYVVALTLAALNFFILPTFTGQTIGKWATGSRIERRSGSGNGPPGFGRIAFRHTIGYLLSLLTFGLGFLLAAFTRDGRALHDRLAGTVVVRERHDTRRLAAARAASRGAGEAVR